jgi:lipid-binding SYLF domain-containing protein
MLESSKDVKGGITMKRSACLMSLLLVAAVIYGCARAQGYSPAQKRQYTQDMKSDTLSELYSRKPETRNLVKNAAGYAVFSNINTQLLWFGTGNGYGVVLDNRTGKNTYMSMGEAGVGIGVGLKDFREVIIFNSRSKLNNFITSGWNVGTVQASAEAKYKEEGASAAGEANLDADIVVYQMTQKGISLRVNFGASKYWKNSELNY